MITYTATNTKTGKFYIGSAKNYCRYTARFGTHHVHKPGSRGYTDFHKDLQADPHSFVWEYSEDSLNTRDTEKALIAIYIDSPFCYNVGEGRHNNHPKGRKHTKETKQKQSISARKHSKRRSEILSKIVNSKEPCPHCGKLMNPGNLKQHLRAQTCQRK
jgi:hypothetical protein